MKKVTKLMLFSSPIIISCFSVVSCAPINKFLNTIKNKSLIEIDRNIEPFFNEAKKEDKDIRELENDIKKAVSELRKKRNFRFLSNRKVLWRFKG